MFEAGLLTLSSARTSRSSHVCWHSALAPTRTVRAFGKGFFSSPSLLRLAERFRFRTGDGDLNHGRRFRHERQWIHKKKIKYALLSNFLTPKSNKKKIVFLQMLTFHRSER